MGGFGSGRPSGSGRIKVEACRSLDVNRMHQAGCLEHGGIELDRGKLDAGLLEALRERCLPEHVETEFTRIMDAVFRV
jgi:hypothetical protein